jgi:uncharacterized protein (TIGR02996 family)
MANETELLERLAANPDDTESLLVYADLLQQAGDPRGELCVVQHELEAAPDDAGLRAREEALFEAHKKSWLGDFDGDDGVELTWRRGFIDAVRIAHDYYRDDEDRSIKETLGPLLDLPVAKLVRTIVVGLWVNDEGQCEYGETAEVLAARRLPSVRKLHLADFKYFGEETEISWTYLGNLSEIWANLPNLEELTLQGGDMTLGQIDLPRVKRVEVITGGLPGDALRSLASARWPEIEELTIYFGSRNYGASGTVEDIAPILAGTGLPKLRSLGLMNAEITDALCALLPKAPIVKQLRALNLSKGLMTIEGARALATGGAALSHLELLDVTENYLSEEAQALVAGLAKEVRAGEQRGDENEEYRYTQVGE